MAEGRAPGHGGRTGGYPREVEEIAEAGRDLAAQGLEVVRTKPAHWPSDLAAAALQEARQHFVLAMAACERARCGG